MKYDYTKSFLKESEFRSETISSGIRPVNEKGKFCGPVFVRIKTDSCWKNLLEETMIILCDYLNRGIITESFFDSKTWSMQGVRENLIADGYCIQGKGKLICLK